MLEDPVLLDTIEEAIQTYFADNATTPTSFLVEWDAFKKKTLSYPHVTGRTVPTRTYLRLGLSLLVVSRKQPREPPFLLALRGAGGGPGVSRGDRPERKPPGSGSRADLKDRKRRRRRGIYGSLEFLGEKPTGSKSPHSPNPGRRSLAPGSIRLGYATLQEKHGQARYRVRDGYGGREAGGGGGTRGK
ncbi:hypothetical protein NDU88_005203 [Pleurodeles waltl]|uniref:Uncharacterized protein n=1 Tax=Pleurodeles waltl TaxID=8319 RepID=A0AAV7RN58_PLEWA|nr:hypothetical protein NDU88_005203 [Pleurodeles waltl]